MIVQYAVGGFDANFAYLVISDNQALIVDPSGDMSELYARISADALDVVGVLITHSHHDHHEKLEEVLERYPVSVYAHTDARDRIASVEDFRASREGDTVSVGTCTLRVLYTPGHMSDSLCYYCAQESWLITGDTLFVEGAGRTRDREHATLLYESLCRIQTLPDDTVIYAGHDYGSVPYATLAHEYEHNRFYRAIADSQEAFIKARLGARYTAL